MTPKFYNAYTEETIYKVEPKYIEPTRNAFQSISIGKTSQMDIFHVNITSWVLYFSHGGRIGYPAWKGDP